MGKRMGRKSLINTDTDSICLDDKGWKSLLCAVIFRAVQDYFHGIKYLSKDKNFYEAQTFLHSEDCKNMLEMIGIPPDRAIRHLKKTAKGLRNGKSSLISDFVAKKRRHTFKSNLLLEKINAGDNGNGDKSLLQSLQ
jgi:hypothetical protein